MRSLKGLVYFLASSLLLIACSSGEASKMNPSDSLPTSTNNNSNISEECIPTDLPLDTTMNGTAGQLYGYTFEAMMQLEEGLNGDMQYIAVDLNPLTQLTEKDKLYILNYLEQQFKITVQDRTFEQLIENEDFSENKLILKGILLRIDTVELGEDTAVIIGSKYRSGKGSVGATIDLALEKGSWKIESAVMTWIS